MPVRDRVVRARVDGGDQPRSNSVRRAEPYGASADLERQPRSAARPPVGLVDDQAVGRQDPREVGAEAARGPAKLVRRIEEDQVVAPALGRRAPGGVAAEHASRPSGRSLSTLRSIVRHASRSDSTKTARRGAARQRLEPHRPRAGEEVEHGGAVDGADQVERGLADAVAGRPRVAALRREDPRAPAGAGDDPHRGTRIAWPGSDREASAPARSLHSRGRTGHSRAGGLGSDPDMAERAYAATPTSGTAGEHVVQRAVVVDQLLRGRARRSSSGGRHAGA